MIMVYIDLMHLLLIYWFEEGFRGEGGMFISCMMFSFTESWILE